MNSQILRSIFEALPETHKVIIEKYNDRIQSELNLPIEEQYKYLLQRYCDNCGISYGFRSVYYDLASIVLKEMIKDEEYPSNEDHAHKYIPDWDDYKHYDAGMKLEPTIALAFKMIWQNETGKKYLPLFCQTLDKFIRDNEEFIDIELLLEEIKNCLNDE